MLPHHITTLKWYPIYVLIVMSDSDRGFDMDEYENELDEIIRPVVPDSVV
jgi:hypothetical protein